MRLRVPFVVGALLLLPACPDDLFSDLRRSDHAPFWGADIPAIFFTDTGEFRNAAYHCMGGEDTIDSLDLDFTARVVAATVGAAAETLGLAP